MTIDEYAAAGGVLLGTIAALALAVTTGDYLGARRRRRRLARMSVTIDGSRPLGVLTTSPLDADDMTALRERWAATHAGARPYRAMVLSDMPGDVYTLPSPPWCAWCLRDHRDDDPSTTCAGCGAPRPYDVAPRPPPRPPAPPPPPTVRLWG